MIDYKFIQIHTVSTIEAPTMIPLILSNTHIVKFTYMFYIELWNEANYEREEPDKTIILSNN
jgi:hypothetical protein